MGKIGYVTKGLEKKCQRENSKWQSGNKPTKHIDRVWAPALPQSKAWNTHELRNHYGIHTFRDLVMKEAPDLMFLQEIRIQAWVMENSKYKLGFANYISLDNEGRSGEITLLWNSKVNLSVLNFSKNHIHVTISTQTMNRTQWLFT